MMYIGTCEWKNSDVHGATQSKDAANPRYHEEVKTNFTRYLFL